MTILKKYQLQNGIKIIMEDLSKILVGDRWNLRLRCLAQIQLQDWMLDKLSEQTDVNEFILQQLNNKLEYEIIKESHFIDQDLKEDAFAKLELRINELIKFIKRDEFVKKLFAIRIAELEKKFDLDLKCNNKEPEDTDNEPVDFSACFQ